MTSPDPRKTIRSLYREVDGYDIPRDDERLVRASRGSPTYGELTPSAVKKLVDYLGLNQRDSFYDLGSGTGKVVLQAAMMVPLRRSIGIELAPSRCKDARSILRRARKQGLIKAKTCWFRNQDLLSAKLDDATVVYTCSTAFSRAFMAKLARKLIALNRDLMVVSLQDFQPRRHLTEVDVLRLDASWDRRTIVYVYACKRRS